MDAHHGISKDDRAHQKGGKKEQLSNRNLKKKNSQGRKFPWKVCFAESSGRISARKAFQYLVFDS